MRALEGLRAIDFSSSPAGAWCSRLLADFGAEVIMVEPPAGHPLRSLPPLMPGGGSVLAEYWFANKRSVTLDPGDAAQRELLRRLTATADVVVSSMRPSELAGLGLAYADIGNPALIMAHITPYGMTGDLAEVPGNDLTVGAMSGWASINGTLDREPLKPSGWQSSYCAGTAAYAAIMAALHHRDTHPGEGQEVDVAEVEVMAAVFAPALLRSEYAGETWTRRKESDMTTGPVPVADGYFSLTISRAHFWRDAMNLLGLHDLAEDPRWEPSHYRGAHKAEYVERVQTAMSTWKKMDLFDELGARRVIAGPVLAMDDLAANEQLRARGFWVTPDEAPAAGEYPGAPFLMSATPWSLRTPAPAAGADTAPLLADTLSPSGETA